MKTRRRPVNRFLLHIWKEEDEVSPRSLVGFCARFIPSRLFITRVLILSRFKEEKKVPTRHVIWDIPSLPFFWDEMKDDERRKGGIKMKGYMGHTQKVHGVERHSGLVFDFCFFMCVLNGSVTRRRWMYE